MSHPRDWIASLLLPGINARQFENLRQQGIDLPRLLAGEAAVSAFPLAAPVRAAILDYQQRGECYRQADSVYQQSTESGWHLLTRDDAAYPPLLLQIADPPIVLWVHGDRNCLSLPQLAVVGSRKSSRDGQQQAHAFARDLAAHGLVITSGLARGIDGSAHAGALAGGGRTIAVFGTGLDRIYPRAHKALAEQIVAEGGALISEYPPGSAPLSYHFPQRNRIISGLSCGTLVVEAAMRSGSLITARQALEQGRSVFALPGSIHNPMSHGCHALIREGATLVENSQQIIEELAPLLGVLPSLPSAPESPTKTAVSVPEADAQLLQQIPFAPLEFDQLAVNAKLTTGELQSRLMALELEGFIEIEGTRIQRLL